jgi:MscS family membrane protein
MDVESFVQETASAIGTERWVVHVFIAVLTTAIVNFAAVAVVRRASARLRVHRSHWETALLDAAGRPLGAAIWIVGIAFAFSLAQRSVGTLAFDTAPLRDVGVIACMSWLLVNYISRVQTHVAQRGGEGAFDRTTVEAIGKLLRVTVVVTAILVGLQTLGFSISGVLAFGGVGGIAVGFAARDLLANFFGGAMIYMDRPFAVGDWIRSPDRDIEGTVEQIGWRLTRIRTFEQRPLYVPNAVFPQISVENPSRMTNRRIFETIGLRYDDAAKVRAVVGDVDAMLRGRDDIDQTQTLMVNLTTFGPSSLDFFVYCFTKTRDWQTYHAVKQDVLLAVLDIVAAHGAEVAFPTSTLHVAEPVRIASAASSSGRLTTVQRSS